MPGSHKIMSPPDHGMKRRLSLCLISVKVFKSTDIPTEMEKGERMITFNIEDEVREAEARIRPYIRETPLEPSLYLSRLVGGDVFLKLENIQVTGSFKLRGAINKYLSLEPEVRKRGVITASSGNHGAAFVYLLKKFDCPGTVFLPENAADVKIRGLRLYDPDLEFFGTDCVQAEIQARRTAQERGQTYISPYNDPKVIGGQGTISVEILRSLPDVDVVFSAVGGGGLISGVAGYLKALRPSARIIGCQPRNSCVMYESVRAGKILDLESLPTLSDATSGGIESDAITLEPCRKYVDDFILLSEEEIRDGIRSILEHHHLLIEGGAALTVAALCKHPSRFRNKTSVLILSGAKISPSTLRAVLNGL